MAETPHEQILKKQRNASNTKDKRSGTILRSSKGEFTPHEQIIIKNNRRPGLDDPRGNNATTGGSGSG